ncbi:MAG: hypothetical protein J6Y39_03980 [Bacteroidaceae bacterium]|nr:hypothetical protein [Bacteroidaceae bacterium]
MNYTIMSATSHDKVHAVYNSAARRTHLNGRPLSQQRHAAKSVVARP